MLQHPWFRDSSRPDDVCLLQKSLYGLKQAPCAWFQRFAMFISRIGFVHSKCDSSLFIYRHGSHMAYLLLYVDDIVLTGSSIQLLSHIISLLSAEIYMSDLGDLNYFLGVSATRTTDGLFCLNKNTLNRYLNGLMCLTANLLTLLLSYLPNLMARVPRLRILLFIVVSLALFSIFHSQGLTLHMLFKKYVYTCMTLGNHISLC